MPTQPYLPFAEKTTPTMSDEDRSEALDLMVKETMPYGLAGIGAGLMGPEGYGLGHLAADVLFTELGKRTKGSSGAELAIGAFTKPKVEQLRGAFKAVLAAKPYLRNLIAEESNKLYKLKGAQEHPTDVFFHGGPAGLERIESPGIHQRAQAQDPNVAVGTHFGMSPTVSDWFARGRPAGKGAMYLAKLKAANPRLYPTETALRKELLAEGLLTGDTQDLVKRAVQQNWIPVEMENQFRDHIKEGNWGKVIDILNRYDIGLEAPGQDRTGTNLVERMLSQGEDAIIYGNTAGAEGWKHNPSVIVPFGEQIEKVAEIPLEGMYKQYLKAPEYFWSPTDKRTAVQVGGTQFQTSQRNALRKRLADILSRVQ